MSLYLRGKTWWADYYDASGRRRRVSLKTQSKAEAKRLHNELLAQSRDVRLGIPRSCPKNLHPASLLKRYLDEHEARVGAKHHRAVERTLRGFLEDTGAVSVSALTRARAEEWLNEQANRRPSRGHAEHRGEGLSTHTLTKYRARLAAWGRWLAQEGHLDHNPFEYLRTRSGTDTRHPRRALTETEVAKVLEVAEPYRRVFYTVLVKTGLRTGEAAQLRWRDVDLAGAHIRVRASASKSAHEVVLPVAQAVVAALREWKERKVELGYYAHVPAVAEAGRGPDDLVFPTRVTTKTWKSDLRLAGVPYRTATGHADMHALRVTFATRLAERGVPLQTAQKLMRHSDPSLTSSIYTRADVAARNAVDGL